MNSTADAGLVEALAAAGFHPLWERYRRLTPMTPRPRDGGRIWRWRDVEPLTARAAAEVALEDAERRAIIMCNPAFGGETVTTTNLISAFTVLEPGDRAPPHRHSAAAIRFSTRADGAATVVQGRRCEMREGDLILTPPYCWHGHVNESDHRIVWFDGADIPLIGALDGSFFESGGGDDMLREADDREERTWAGAGLAPVGAEPTPPHSPKFRYPGEATRRTLDALRPGDDGARLLRYVNPLTGGAVMATLDCYALRLRAGAETRPRRTSWNAVCLVAAGEGSSTVGDDRFEWSRHDVFTVPHWSWASHRASGGDADLFLLTDRAVHERLGLIRVETQG